MFLIIIALAYLSKWVHPNNCALHVDKFEYYFSFTLKKGMLNNNVENAVSINIKLLWFVGIAKYCSLKKILLKNNNWKRPILKEMNIAISL